MRKLLIISFRGMLLVVGKMVGFGISLYQLATILIIY